MKLYELTDKYNQLLEVAEELDPTAFQDTLQALEDDIEDKAENIAKLIRTLTSDIDIIKAEEKRLAERRKSVENRISDLKEYLQNQMEVAGIDKVKRPTLTISIQNNPPSVKVTDETLLFDYMIIPEPKIDKKALLADLKNGVEIAGAEIQQTRGIRIR